jgi:hypothetical protein
MVPAAAVNLDDGRGGAVVSGRKEDVQLAFPIANLDVGDIEMGGVAGGRNDGARHGRFNLSESSGGNSDEQAGASEERGAETVGRCHGC